MKLNDAKPCADENAVILAAPDLGFYPVSEDGWWRVAELSTYDDGTRIWTFCGSDCDHPDQDMVGWRIGPRIAMPPTEHLQKPHLTVSPPLTPPARA